MALLGSACPWLDLLIEDTQHVIRQRLDVPSALMLALTCRHEYTRARVKPSSQRYGRSPSLLAQAAHEQHWALVSWGMDEAGYTRSLGSEFVIVVFAHRGRIDLVARALHASKPMNRRSRLLMAMRAAACSDQVCVFAWCRLRLASVPVGTQDGIERDIGRYGCLRVFKWLCTRWEMPIISAPHQFNVLGHSIRYAQPVFMYRLLDPARPTNILALLTPAILSTLFIIAAGVGQFTMLYWLLSRLPHVGIEPPIMDMLVSGYRDDTALLAVCTAAQRVYPLNGWAIISRWSDLCQLTLPRLQWIVQNPLLEFAVDIGDIIFSFAYVLRQKGGVVFFDLYGPHRLRDAIPALQWLRTAGHLTPAFLHGLTSKVATAPRMAPGLPDAYTVLREVFTAPAERAHVLHALPDRGIYAE